MDKHDNVGKCGHAKCAGGNGCYETGKPMRSYEEIKAEYQVDIFDPAVCPSSLDEYNGPLTGETAHKWDDTTDPVTCAECGATNN